MTNEVNTMEKITKEEFKRIKTWLGVFRCEFGDDDYNEDQKIMLKLKRMVC